MVIEKIKNIETNLILEALNYMLSEKLKELEFDSAMGIEENTSLKEKAEKTKELAEKVSEAKSIYFDYED